MPFEGRQNPYAGMSEDEIAFIISNDIKRGASPIWPTTGQMISSPQNALSGAYYQFTGKAAPAGQGALSLTLDAPFTWMRKNVGKMVEDVTDIIQGVEGKKSWEQVLKDMTQFGSYAENFNWFGPKHPVYNFAAEMLTTPFPSLSKIPGMAKIVSSFGSVGRGVIDQGMTGLGRLSPKSAEYTRYLFSPTGEGIGGKAKDIIDQIHMGPVFYGGGSAKAWLPSHFDPDITNAIRADAPQLMQTFFNSRPINMLDKMARGIQPLILMKNLGSFITGNILSDAIKGIISSRIEGASYKDIVTDIVKAMRMSTLEAQEKWGAQLMHVNVMSGERGSAYRMMNLSGGYGKEMGFKLGKYSFPIESSIMNPMITDVQSHIPINLNMDYLKTINPLRAGSIELEYQRWARLFSQQMTGGMVRGQPIHYADVLSGKVSRGINYDAQKIQQVVNELGLVGRATEQEVYQAILSKNYAVPMRMPFYPRNAGSAQDYFMQMMTGLNVEKLQGLSNMKGPGIVNRSLSFLSTDTFYRKYAGLMAERMGLDPTQTIKNIYFNYGVGGRLNLQNVPIVGSAFPFITPTIKELGWVAKYPVYRGMEYGWNYSRAMMAWKNRPGTEDLTEHQKFLTPHPLNPLLRGLGSDYQFMANPWGRLWMDPITQLTMLGGGAEDIKITDTVSFMGIHNLNPIYETALTALQGGGVKPLPLPFVPESISLWKYYQNRNAVAGEGNKYSEIYRQQLASRHLKAAIQGFLPMVSMGGTLQLPMNMNVEMPRSMGSVQRMNYHINRRTLNQILNDRVGGGPWSDFENNIGKGLAIGGMIKGGFSLRDYLKASDIEKIEMMGLKVPNSGSSPMRNYLSRSGPEITLNAEGPLTEKLGTVMERSPAQVNVKITPGIEERLATYKQYPNAGIRYRAPKYTPIENIIKESTIPGTGMISPEESYIGGEYRLNSQTLEAMMESGEGGPSQYLRQMSRKMKIDRFGRLGGYVKWGTMGINLIVSGLQAKEELESGETPGFVGAKTAAGLGGLLLVAETISGPPGWTTMLMQGILGTGAYFAGRGAMGELYPWQKREEQGILQPEVRWNMLQRYKQDYSPRGSKFMSHIATSEELSLYQNQDLNTYQVTQLRNLQAYGNAPKGIRGLLIKQLGKEEQAFEDQLKIDMIEKGYTERNLATMKVRSGFYGGMSRRPGLTKAELGWIYQKQGNALMQEAKTLGYKGNEYHPFTLKEIIAQYRIGENIKTKGIAFEIAAEKANLPRQGRMESYGGEPFTFDRMSEYMPTPNRLDLSGDVSMETLMQLTYEMPWVEQSVDINNRYVGSWEGKISRRAAKEIRDIVEDKYIAIQKENKKQEIMDDAIRSAMSFENEMLGLYSTDVTGHRI